MKKVLTIAGSYCSGGAGIQADLKTITAQRLYGMSVITSLTAQNTTGVYGIVEIEPAFVKKQMDCVFQDIFPDAVKIGMVCSVGIIEEVAKGLKHFKAQNVVLDPVMIATSGHKLLKEEAIEALTTQLFPLATLITPNLEEAAFLGGMEIKTKNDMMEAAEAIYKKYERAILIKGGHLIDSADDLFYQEGEGIWIKGERIKNENNHGTGCTLSSAIACGLAQHTSLEQSIKQAKRYITQVLKSDLNLGKGNGPLDHMHFN